MKNIEQLKSIRDEALARLQGNPDYKLLTSLDGLIVELEGVMALAELAEQSVAKTSSTPKSLDDTSLDKAFDAITTSNTKPTTIDKAKSNGVVDLANEINGGVPLS